MMASEADMATMKEITVGTDYTTVPGGRFKKYGEFSGEDFRDSVLVPALQAHDKVVVYLDGTKAYMSSFLEEAFGGLIRERGFSFDDLKQRLLVTAKNARYSIYVRMVADDMADAAAEAAGKKPARVA
jgi:STAS-like domain of unknown function (DUF4325)